MNNPEIRSRMRAPMGVAFGLALSLGLSACSGGEVAAPHPAATASSSEQGHTAEALQKGTVDLLGPESHWQMAGVQPTDGTLQVSYVGRSIVHQDGSEGYENPAANLYGTALAVKGPFVVTADITGIQGEAGISLYGKPPIIEDETRAEQATVDTAIEGTSFWHQETTQPTGRMPDQESTIANTPTHQLAITVADGRITFAVDGRIVSQSPDTGMFAGGRVYIGLDARQQGSSFTVNGLKAQGIQGGTVQAVDTRTQAIRPGKGFKDAAKKPIGAAVALGPMIDDARYQTILFTNFDQISIENALKAQFVQPQQGLYTFQEADAIVAMARAHGITNIHGHAITFSEAQPAWLQDLEQNDPAAYRQAILDHITTVVGHYKDTINSWDVNEPLADYDEPTGELGLRDNALYRKVAYIAEYVKAIRAANPQAQIWLNDFGMESDPDRRAQMIDLATALKQKGAPVTGIGFQAHLDGGDVEDAPTSADRRAMFQEAFRDVQAAGLEVRISELDIEDDVPQETVADAVAACMGSAACTGVTIWGITDRYSSGSDVDPGTGALRTYTGLSWDNNLRPTAAVGFITKALG